jgi:tetraprenyl-beta-curcumene synthase
MPHPPDTQDEAMRPSEHESCHAIAIQRFQEDMRPPGEHGLAQRLALTGTFVCAALRYWLVVFPRTCIELRGWRRRAARIGDPVLRTVAFEALGKRANIEGAAAFAAVMPGRRRGKVVRALVAFQAIYNYCDLLAEQPSSEPAPNARHLHAALLVALEPGAQHRDYYACHGQCDDGGYLAEMVDACRSALSALPSGAAVAVPARRSAARIVAFQSLSLGERDELERWARSQQVTDSRLMWWEAAAAAGSSLGVHALLAAAAAPSLRDRDVAAIETAYFPWVGALHSLLDSVVDEAEDAATGQLSLVGCYRSAPEAAVRMRWLALRALQAASALPAGRRHAVLVVAMACSYLSAPEVAAPDRLALAQAVRDTLGAIAGPALLIFRIRLLASRVVARKHGAATAKHVLAARLSDGRRGADAGAA